MKDKMRMATVLTETRSPVALVLVLLEVMRVSFAKMGPLRHLALAVSKLS